MISLFSELLLPCYFLYLNIFHLGLAELASWMAFKGQGLMSEATWDEMHSEATTEYDRMFYGNYIKAHNAT